MWILAPIILLSAELSSKENPPVLEWQEAAPSDWVDRLKNPKVDISDMLFDAVDDFDFLSSGIGDLNVTMGVERKVFDNFDARGSYTVVDQFKTNAYYPVAESKGSPLGFWLGTEAGMDFLQIRQVLPKEELPNLITEEDLKSQDSDLPLPPEAKTIRLQTMLEAVNEGIPSLYPDHTQNNARFDHFLSLLLIPGRVPFSLDKFKAMKVGEVLSVTMHGMVEVGAKATVDLVWSDYLGDLGASARVFVEGDFRVTLLKEDLHRAKLKVTRMRGSGVGARAGGKAKPSFFNGTIILKKIDDELKIVPFELLEEDRWQKVFDRVFRYDLSKDTAVDAYLKAMRGQLALSDELVLEKNKGVEWLGDRKSDVDTKYRKQQLRLALILKEKRETTLRTVNATLISSSGERKIFTSSVDNSKQWKWFLAFTEKFNRHFDVSLDPQAEDFNSRGLQLSVQADLEDNMSHTSELLSYINETESAINTPKWLPRPPESKDWKEPQWGRSKFFYQLKISSEELHKFIFYPEDLRWAALEKAFQVHAGTWQSLWKRRQERFVSGAEWWLTLPFYVTGFEIKETMNISSATTIKKIWDKISSPEVSDSDRVVLLGALFYQPIFSQELIKLLRVCLHGEKIAYRAMATSRIFGRMTAEGESPFSYIDTQDRIKREWEFDRQEGRLPEWNLLNQVEQLTVMKSQQKLKLDFRVQQNPKLLYLDIFKENFFSFLPGSRSKVGTIIVKEPQLNPGQNAWVLDQANEDFKEIQPLLKSGSRYRLRMAISQDGIFWGPVKTTTFKW